MQLSQSGGQDQSLLSEALGRIAADAARHEGPSSVLLLGRYRHMRPGNLPAFAKRHPGLRLSYMTVDGSKGHQADYVVVLGLCTGRHGVPTEIADNPLLNLALSAPEKHPNAEERCLFYVALTEARRHVFVLADGDPQSSFVLELIQGNYDVAIFGRLPEKDVTCPTCVRGIWCVTRMRKTGAPSTAARTCPPANTPGTLRDAKGVAGGRLASRLGADWLEMFIDATHADETAKPVRRNPEPEQTATFDGVKAHLGVPAERECSGSGLHFDLSATVGEIGRSKSMHWCVSWPLVAKVFVYNALAKGVEVLSNQNCQAERTRQE